MRIIKPTKEFYKSFRIYRPNRKCKECHQIIKSKRPNTKFYFINFIKGNSDMIRVKVTGRKTILNIHKKYFKNYN